MKEYLETNPDLPKSNDIMERARINIYRQQNENKFLKNAPSPTFQSVITHEYGVDKSDPQPIIGSKKKFDPCFQEKPEINKKGKGIFENYGQRHFEDAVTYGKR